MKNKSILILAAVFIVLAVVYFATTYHPPEMSHGATMLFENGMPQVDRIEVGMANQPEVALAKSDGAWYMESPFAFKADDQYVNGLLSMVNEVMVDAVVSTREDAQSEYQVADSTGVALKLYSGGELVFDYLIGKRSQEVGRSYARHRGSNDIELWRSMLSMEVRREADQWRDRTIYSINSDDIIRIEAVEADTTRVLTFADTVWVYTENGVVKPADDTRTRMVVMQIADLAAEDFASTSDIQRVAGNDPEVVVSFTVRNGDVHTYHVWRPLGQSLGFLLRKEDGDVLYRLSQYKGQRIAIDYSQFMPLQ